MVQPPHRWRDWKAVFHPKFTGQIIGYVRLKHNDWFVWHEENKELYGPFRYKRSAMNIIKAKTCKKIESGWYQALGYDLFTRVNAPIVIGKELDD